MRRAQIEVQTGDTRASGDAKAAPYNASVLAVASDAAANARFPAESEGATAAGALLGEASTGLRSAGSAGVHGAFVDGVAVPVHHYSMEPTRPHHRR